MQEDLLRRTAELSGGRCFTARDLPELAKELSGERRSTSVRLTKELFDLPVVFALLLGLLAVEWMVRRRSDLV